MRVDLQFVSCSIENAQLCPGWVFGTLKGGSGKTPRHAKDAESWFVSGTAKAAKRILRGRGHREKQEWRRRVMFRFSNGLSNWTRVTQRAWFEFVNLPPDNADKVLAYIREYGVFAEEDLRPRPGLPAEVRRFWKEAKSSNLLPFATELAAAWRVRGEIAELLALGRAILRRNQETAKRLCRQIAQPLDLSEERDWLHFARHIFRVCITRGLADVGLGPSEESGELISSVFSIGVRPALYLRLLFLITSKASVAECKNRKCGKFFLATRSWHRFCGPNCQALVKQNRWRRKKKKSKKRK